MTSLYSSELEKGGKTMDSLQELGKLVKKSRKKLKLSQEKLAELCGLSTRQVTKIEKGRVNPKFTTIVRLCIELHINCGELEDFYSFPDEE